MNKTIILAYGLDKLFLKSTNVSRKMRKRALMVLNKRTLVLKENSRPPNQISIWKEEKELKRISLWFRWTTGKGTEITNSSQMKKGVSNYIVRQECHVKKIIDLNGSVQCHELKFSARSSLQISNLNLLRIRSRNDLERIKKVKIEKVNSLVFDSLDDFSIISEVLNNLKTVKNLLFKYCQISKLKVPSSHQIDTITFEGGNFKDEIKIYNVRHIKIISCGGLDLLKIYFVRKLTLKGISNESKSFLSTLGQLKSIKEIKSSQVLEVIPRSTQSLNFPHFEFETSKIEVISFLLPFLRLTNAKVTIEAAKTLNLREFKPDFQGGPSKSIITAKKLILDRENVEFVAKNPKVLGKTPHLVVKTSKFDFSSLPSSLKSLELQGEFDIKCNSLKSAH